MNLLNKQLFFCVAVTVILSSCQPVSNESETANFLTDYPAKTKENGNVNAVIEIPAGSTEKWELNKQTGKIERDSINNKPRTINYLGYPTNYGMIPQTLLSKESGGDGDPLDIIVIGPTLARGNVTACKVIGVLYLKDNNEQDDKIIAIAKQSSMYNAVNTIEELNQKYTGIVEIIELWFTNYKGAGVMKSGGFGTKATALQIVDKAILDFSKSGYQ